MSAEEKLSALGLTLPPPAAPVGSYVPFVQVGDLVMTSGQLPLRDGRLVATGKVGADLTIQQGAECARAAVLNALAQVAAAAGGLDRITRIVRLGVFVNSAVNFIEQPKVANGASDLLVAIFGDAGRHVRTAVGASELPLDAPVEIELTAQVQDKV
jgi:enamine deaminase RidA (YjgF/YER057c/UK114 family)